MLSFNFEPFPVFETERLILRRFTINDAVDYLALRSDVQAMKYIEKPKPQSIQEIYDLINTINNGINNNENIGWAIQLKNELKMIGSIGYHRVWPENHRAEIGYMLHPLHWRKGYMNEAVKKIIDFGFNEMKLHSIEANINPANKASAQLLLKNKFVKEGYFKEDYYFNGRFLDTEIYSLLNNGLN